MQKSQLYCSCNSYNSSNQGFYLSIFSQLILKRWSFQQLEHYLQGSHPWNYGPQIWNWLSYTACCRCISPIFLEEHKLSDFFVSYLPVTLMYPPSVFVKMSSLISLFQSYCSLDSSRFSCQKHSQQVLLFLACFFTPYSSQVSLYILHFIWTNCFFLRSSLIKQPHIHGSHSRSPNVRRFDKDYAYSEHSF